MKKMQKKQEQFMRNILVGGFSIILGLTGCGTTTNSGKDVEKQEGATMDQSIDGIKDDPVLDHNKIQVVTTIFPIYDWVRHIAGVDNPYVEIEMLYDNGVDLHSYQPVTEDLIQISECDLFLYVGGASDHWIEDALESPANSDRVAMNLLDILGDTVKIEEQVEGMQVGEHHHNHDGGHDENESSVEVHAEEMDSQEVHHEDAVSKEVHEESEDNIEVHEESKQGVEVHQDSNHSEETHDEKDEHVWLSLRNAKVISREIGAKLSEIDPVRASLYQTNTQAYVAELDKLDQKYQSTVDAARYQTIVFADRFPFRYLVDDYELAYYAAFPGCSAETETSFETVTFLANKVDELETPMVLTMEGDNHKIAETIIANTKSKDQTIGVLNSMQAITTTDVEAGNTYLEIMKDNLEVLQSVVQ